MTGLFSTVLNMSLIGSFTAAGKNNFDSMEYFL